MYRYILTAPKIIRAGASEKIVVQAFGYQEEFPVSVALKSFPDKLVVYSSARISLNPGNKFQDAVTLTVRNSHLSYTLFIITFRLKKDEVLLNFQLFKLGRKGYFALIFGLKLKIR